MPDKRESDSDTHLQSSTRVLGLPQISQLLYLVAIFVSNYGVVERF